MGILPYPSQIAFVQHGNQYAPPSYYQTTSLFNQTPQCSQAQLYNQVPPYAQIASYNQPPPYGQPPPYCQV
ncbi:unnamed protein product [Adineta steineri]|uniref:Uncharacterized protein n=1 Tax=Adineta steineri TaxID=433720 RepID=A0A813NBG4_9BILA|nr:unnamed protein product [Adineta steineri]CAF0748601.1 unnamed protein product [Adineta steineri]CAF0786009.1 unnamed protein product [Adineta steineri]CAF0789364.1 unnamed protein product [Adineta steineri]CAF0791792.1 unnamed protein product [Adineta steineri]